jgi:hypothetical protein
MKLYKFFFLILSFFFFFLLFSSCGGTNLKTESRSSQLNSIDNPTSKTPHFTSKAIEVKTYQVNDSIGKLVGWGYDIYLGGKKIIHQPIIPALPGNRSFKTEVDAQKIGFFAADKMLKGSSLPTISIMELDSLGIQK